MTEVVDGAASGGEGGTGGDGGEGAAAGGGDSGQAAGGTGGGAVWYGELSTDAADDKSPSDADWMKGKGFADPAAMVKSYRSLEKRLGGDNRIEVPGEGATEEQVKAYRAAIGVPENVEDYGFDVPDGWEQDVEVLGGLREAALTGGMPKPAWDGLVKAYTEAVMDRHNALVDAQNAEKDEWKRAQGATANQNETLAKRGFEAFGLDADKVQAMQSVIGEGGTKFMLDLGLKLGRLAGEDTFVAGNKRDFGVAPAEARTKLTEFENDRGKAAKLAAKDPATIAEHERLVAMVAHADEMDERRAQAA